MTSRLLALLLLGVAVFTWAGCAASGPPAPKPPPETRFNGWEKIASPGQENTYQVYLHCAEGNGLYQKPYYDGAMVVVVNDPLCKK